MATRRVLPEVTGHRVWYRLKDLVETFPTIYISWGWVFLKHPNHEGDTSTRYLIEIPKLLGPSFSLRPHLGRQ